MRAILILGIAAVVIALTHGHSSPANIQPTAAQAYNAACLDYSASGCELVR